jgi:hypothetical protein
MEGYYYVTYHIISHPRTLYVVHNTSHASKSETRHMLAFYGNCMHWGLPYSKEKLASVTLHNIVPKLCCNDLLLWKASCDEGPTCDDMHVLFN